jgi:D-mannonate dehydratase
MNNVYTMMETFQEMIHYFHIRTHQAGGVGAKPRDRRPKGGAPQ